MISIFKMMITQSAVRLDCNDITLNIVYIILILLECHRNHGDINFLVDTTRLHSVLEDDLGLMASFNNLFACLYSHIYRCHILCLLECLLMSHEDSENTEEDIKKSKTREYYSHREDCNTESVWVVMLQFGSLCFSSMNIVV